MKGNLTLLLSNDADIETLPDLPSEDDMVNAFHLQETEKDTGQSTSQRESDNDVEVMVNELCIVIWDDKPGQRNWYVGMCRSKDEETYEIEHMERVNMRNNKQSPHERWRWPHSLEEFYQHVVLAYAEIFFVISSYLWPPESKSGWCKCVHVERSEIWVKSAIFWSKNIFSACCEVFTQFSLSIRIDNNFLIIIAGDSTTYLLLYVYFKSKMWIFSIFG